MEALLLTEPKRCCHPSVDIFVWVCVVFVAVRYHTSPGVHGGAGVVRPTNLCYFAEELETETLGGSFKIFF